MEQDMATSFEDAGTGVPGRNGIPFSRRDLLALAVLGLASSASRVALAAAPQGQLTWGVHVSLAPTWFDPAETPGIITPFMVLYALHDAMVKPMPGQPMAASLAESWSASEDALIYAVVRPRHRTDAGGFRRLLAQAPGRQAFSIPLHSG